jgi:glycosyltransferase involved in cell wall biosynthesis
MDRNVIVVAYNFPPDGSAGVYRPLRFVQHLHAIGWNPTVISVKADYYERYDPRLLDGLSKEIEIVRVGQHDPWQAFMQKRAKRIAKRIENCPTEIANRIQAAHNAPLRSRIRELLHSAEAWCYHPDTTMCWIAPAVREALKICDRHRPNAIYATGGPWSSFIVARRVSQQTGIPYIIDFRDSWTMSRDDFDLRRPAWAIRGDRRTLYKLLEGAHAIVFRYLSEAECYWRAYRDALSASKIHIIPNGYSGRIEEFVHSEGAKCTVLYAGTLSPYYYDSLLQALKDLKNSDPHRASQLRFVFVGEGTEVLASQAATVGISDLVETMSAVPYSSVLRLQQSAHALLLLGVKPMKGYELCGSKVFGYLKANRPILGIVSAADEMRKVLHRVGVSTIADNASTSEIVLVLRRLIDAWSAGRLSDLLPKPAACEVYSAERQTAALIRAFEGQPALEPFIPGAVELPPSLRQELADGDWVSKSSKLTGLMRISPQ